MAIVANWQHWEGRIVNGRFPLRQYLGGSEHSAVFLTEVEGGRAALKLMPADARYAQAQVACWKLAARLSHPNLVRVIQTGVWQADTGQDMVFAVMEYCDETLAAVLQQRPLTPNETREMLVPALDALEYLHTQGLVHGQINPANILAVDDQLKLSSDGICRSGETDTPHAAGPYDAPERRNGDGLACRRSLVFGYHVGRSADQPSAGARPGRQSAAACKSSSAVQRHRSGLSGS